MVIVHLFFFFRLEWCSLWSSIWVSQFSVGVYLFPCRVRKWIFKTTIRVCYLDQGFSSKIFFECFLKPVGVYVHLRAFFEHSNSVSTLLSIRFLCMIFPFPYFAYYYSLIRAFHIRDSRWFFTEVWVTAKLLKSPGLFLVFCSSRQCCHLDGLHSSANLQVL